MANPLCEVLVSEERIAPLSENVPEETGAIVDFWGVVRRTEDARDITGIAYEAHRPMAEHQLRAIAEQALREFNLTAVRVQHRIGFVAEGEASLLVRVGSRHRPAAFCASAWIVEELKKRAPIWKHPAFNEATAGQARDHDVKATPGRVAEAATRQDRDREAVSIER
jgi:molybdopterin synthase catalytic subunit